MHHGRHFGRTVHALCTVSTLLNNGILRMGELADRTEETFTQECVMMSMFVLVFNIILPSTESDVSIEFFAFSFRWYLAWRTA